MKKILSIFLVSLIMVLSVFNLAEAKTIKVKPYYKPSTGRYVQPHYKTSPNKTKFDNYSTKGNYNPYTGKKGYASPYKTYKFR
ncbi:hypothetical protein KKD57_03220 [Patescibacteria group bacterium]|nr:hypothetical protein [Patescibacteria group bacterium]